MKLNLENIRYGGQYGDVGGVGGAWVLLERLVLKLVTICYKPYIYIYILKFLM